ncbi:PadR family transcriptional regulator [Aurantiacibacter sediminis]|uniref:PadR family transcriptional regulator n=1 Tax=Aurantiacibacter sediminis TaxID=2793064 RepID=A0ABS0N649_9SPHN|nr:PadR family transcriptional regulator [Aurantiacibacter sediminis]MBH5323248.1 PadR family transcriptional regulator [Aurantiacibacter sediminis]
MAKKKEAAGRPRKPRKATVNRKATTRRTTKPKEEVIEEEDLEPVEGETPPEGADFDVHVEVEIEDHPEGEDFDVDVDVDIEDEEYTTRAGRRNRNRAEFKRQFKREFKREFNTEDIFGPDGVFGRNGPFGDNGPFSASGIFGPGGLFAMNNNRNRGRGPRRGGSPRKRERMFGPGELRLVLLAMLAEEPRHGYELIKSLEEMTGGAYSPSPGTIYPTLQMLSDEGMIEEQESEDSRKLYQATASGIDELQDRGDEVDELWERLGRKAERAKPAAGSSDVFRSLGNLATVLTNKAARGDLKDVQKEQVIDLIDALARKIERL